MELALIKIIPGVGSTPKCVCSAVAGQSPAVEHDLRCRHSLVTHPQSGGGTMDLYTPGYYYTFRMAPQNMFANVGSGNYLHSRPL